MKSKRRLSRFRLLAAEKMLGAPKPPRKRAIRGGKQRRLRRANAARALARRIAKTR